MVSSYPQWLMGTYLDDILAAHRTSAASETRSLDQLIAAAKQLPSCRGFAAAIQAHSATGQLAVIAEIKRRSPSKGDLFASLDPGTLAAEYESGGATCLSVLTDVDHFGGSPDDLRAARAGVSIPVIRKDFTVSAHDVADARLMGADAVLLICAALDDSELGDFSELAAELGLDVLVETHDEAEVERALECGATLIGVNQRDLVTFKVDTDRAVRVLSSIPPGVTRVAESGVGGAADAERLRIAGYDAVLVGETLVTSEDPRQMVTALRSA